MPMISVQGGTLSAAQKEELIRELTAAASRVMRVPEEFFMVAIHELPDENIGIGGRNIGMVKTEYAKAHDGAGGKENPGEV